MSAVHGRGFKASLICYPYFPSRESGRGLDRYIHELQKNLKLCCPEVEVQTLHRGYAKNTRAAALKKFGFIADLLRTEVDLFHAISPIGGAAAAILGKRPLVVTIHDLLSFDLKGYDYSWKLRYLRLCTRLSVRKCDAIIVGHDHLRQQIISRFKVSASKIQVVRYGVDHQHFYPRPAIQRSSRKILFVGEVSRAKGVETLIRAFCAVKQLVSDAELIIGGKSSRDQKPLERICCESGVRGVTFIGRISGRDLPDLYSSAAVLVFPSRCGFGLIPLEAMACGTPVIIGDAFDAPEFIAEAGLLANPYDPDALAIKIARVLTEPGLREHLSEKAVERAKEFSWGRMARETAGVYRERIHAK